MNKELRKILMRKVIRHNRKLGSGMNLPVYWDEGNNYVAVKLEDGTLLDAYYGIDGIHVYENMILIGGWRDCENEYVESLRDFMRNCEPENPDEIEWYSVRKDRNNKRRIRRIEDRREHYAKLMRKGA